MKNRKPQGGFTKYVTSLPPDLAAVKKEIEGYAREYGLDFFDVIFEVLDWNQLNEVAAYGGFPNRYPHWRYGMEYEELSKSYSYGLSKIYEMVINNDPCYAYLLYSNGIVDQKLVMAHVYAHCDFFKNNLFFAHTNRKMMDEMANHKTRIMRYIDEYGHDKVEDFIDSCLAIETLIDYHAPAIKRRSAPKDEAEGPRRPVKKLSVHRQYMDKFINPQEFLDEQRQNIEKEMEKEKHFPEHPEKDAMLFLLEHAPLERWERDVLSMIREETYYFAPQGQTKVLNEGWACVTPDTLIYTDRGLLRAEEIVAGRITLNVYDGETNRKVTDYARFSRRRTVKITTKRGYELDASDTHRVLLSDGKSWKRLDEIKKHDLVSISGGADLWPKKYVPINWSLSRRKTLEDVATEADVNLSTVIRHRAGAFHSKSAAAMDAALVQYDSDMQSMSFMQNKRKDVLVPAFMTEDLAAFLGYLTGDGHISRVKRVMGLTTGDAEQAAHFAALTRKLFGLRPKIKVEERKRRVLFSSENLREFLEHLGMKAGFAAREKAVPDMLLRSPKKVMAAFLRALYDCDGYAGPGGVILSTSSTEMAKAVQIILLNFGVISTRRKQAKGIWNIESRGLAAKKFQEQIGFGLKRKRDRLASYINGHSWFKDEDWRDEIVSIEHGISDVCDMTVAGSHRYAAHGFINHNSFWHSKIMTERALNASEIIDYADHHSGTVAMNPRRVNPYKIGLELFRDIEERWNKGRFGKAYEECQDMVAKKNWDLKLGLGRKKIFEIRKLYSDVMFIDEFLTPEFCERHKLFVYAYNVSSDQYEIASREFEKIKKQFLFQLTNFGQPIINVVEGNFRNRGELLLKHTHEGVDLKHDYACETLKRLYKIWRRPVTIETVVDGIPKMIICEGQEIREERV